MTDRAAKLRAFYARFVAVRAGAVDPRIEAAFAAVPREPFVGPAPWSIPPVSPWHSSGPNYLRTPDDDPAFLYQDVLIALDAAKGINIGEPSLHAHCLDALAIQEGESVLHVGAGSGYYTAIIAHLAGAGGHVDAFEIEADLAARAARNLADAPAVTVHHRSGIAADLPKADAVYVSAGITQPSRTWLDALHPGGRLLFPLQPEQGAGAMLLVQKPREGGTAWPARFVTRAAFIACQARQDHEAGRELAAAFAGGNWQSVKSLHLDGGADATCWFRGDGWWLSVAPA
ncbi:MAG: methyltransferase [Alphaproteobacteria bacterium]|nr:methyltransferase [Alphaproteobacteria bacterium]